MYTTTFVISYQITYTHYLTEEHITKYDTERIINRLLMKTNQILKKKPSRSHSILGYFVAIVENQLISILLILYYAQAVI